MTTIIERARKYFIQTMDNFGSDPYRLRIHVLEVEKWANHLLKKYPEADFEVTLLAVWMHDLGHYPIIAEVDHAVKSKEKAKAFLKKISYAKDKMDRVLHCVRAHRCCDVMPNSIEAKILACADSASHMTDSMYFNMAKDDKENNREFRVYAKMDRDFRDLGAFPEIQNELKELYENWKQLIKTFENIETDNKSFKKK